MRQTLPFPSSGLYAITRDDARSRTDDLAAGVRGAIRGGVAVVQYRAKGSNRDTVADASALLSTCHAAGVPLIVNDDIELALAVGADGVHLGRDDMSLAEARQRLGAAAIIGVSCYDDADRAAAAEAGGADYVAFGRFFPSASKPLAPCARLETLREARRRLGLPIVAIGGITPENGRVLLQAGADLLAVIEGVFGDPRGPECAARAFRELWAAGEPGRAVNPSSVRRRSDTP